MTSILDLEIPRWRELSLALAEAGLYRETEKPKQTMFKGWRCPKCKRRLKHENRFVAKAYLTHDEKDSYECECGYKYVAITNFLDY